MSRNVANSAKAQRDKLRERMRSYGCTTAQIAAEMGRRFNLRSRVAWRYALGWPQWKVAQQYNTLHTGSRLSHGRVSDIEKWPHGGSPPSPRYLVKLAATFGHGCTAAQLVDADDLELLTPTDRCLLTDGRPAGSSAPPAPPTFPETAPTTVGDQAEPGRALSRGNGDTGIVRCSRRIVRCDARGVPVGEEIIVAAEESAQFWRWSATTNVDDDVLEQMTADVAESPGASSSIRRPPPSRRSSAPATMCSP